MKLTFVVFVAMTTAVVVAGRPWRMRRCGADQGDAEGETITWTRTGQAANGLRVTSSEEAFAPDGERTVHKSPRDRMMVDMGIQKTKVVYDFSTDTPIAVLRLGRRGWGPCVLVQPDFHTYEELMDELLSRNMSNLEMPDEESGRTLVATQTSDDSSFSQVVRDLCSKDQCGRPIQPVYFTTEHAIATDVSDGLTFVLVEDRITVSGLSQDAARDQRRQNRQQRRQQRRQERRQNQGPSAGQNARWQRRQERRQQRRQNRGQKGGRNGRWQRRQERRQQRRQSRRQGAREVAISQ